MCPGSTRSSGYKDTGPRRGERWRGGRSIWQQTWNEGRKLAVRRRKRVAAAVIQLTNRGPSCWFLLVRRIEREELLVGKVRGSGTEQDKQLKRVTGFLDFVRLKERELTRTPLRGDGRFIYCVRDVECWGKGAGLRIAFFAYELASKHHD